MYVERSRFIQLTEFQVIGPRNASHYYYDISTQVSYCDGLIKLCNLRSNQEPGNHRDTADVLSDTIF